MAVKQRRGRYGSVSPCCSCGGLKRRAIEVDVRIAVVAVVAAARSGSVAVAIEIAARSASALGKVTGDRIAANIADRAWRCVVQTLAGGINDLPVALLAGVQHAVAAGRLR